MGLTPAEIIAARVNGLDESDSEDSRSFDDDTTITSVPSITDDTAFPTLGGKRANVSPNNWVRNGAIASSPVTPPSSSPGVGSAGSTGAAPRSYKIKSSTIQEAFSLDGEDQVNVTRPEFIKILTAIKSDTKTNIECTVSQLTQKRMFLISGRPEDVKLAKRLVIKKLTKSVNVKFSVPSKLRSRIIGAQGKNIKPIISEYDVRIDVGNEETVQSDNTDDIFSKTIQVNIDGDFESCQIAKAKILDIVKQETKDALVKLPVDGLVKPFAAKFLEPLIEQYSTLEIIVPEKESKADIYISGDRELVLQARDDIQLALENSIKKIYTEEVAIPKLKHQFLPIDKILNEDNVLIQLPVEPDTKVKFIGERANINRAKEKARTTTSQFKVEVLDMSKAHKGNLNHVKAVAEYLNNIGFFDDLRQTHNVVVKSPRKKDLEEATDSIPIEIIYNHSDTYDDVVKVVKKEIVAKVNSLTPESVKSINDIDSFLIVRVPSIIDELAQSLGVSVVILNSNITLFFEKQVETDDFVEDSTSDDFNKINESLNDLRDLKSSLGSESLTVDSSELTFIKASLNSIVSELEPNSVIIDVNDTIQIHGIKSQVHIAKQLIESIIKDGKEFGISYTSAVNVPTSVLSRLIGKKGTFLNSLRDEFNVKLDVIEDENSKSKSEISIVGPKRNVDLCKQKITSLSKRWADETTESMKIERQYHRRIVGPNGIYVNRLQDKYGVRIQFPSLSDKTSNEITIRGPSKSVAGAKGELKELYDFERENGFVETIKIPIKAISRVIGKNGETINGISDSCGIEYRFIRDDAKEQESGFAEVTLTGSKSGLKDVVFRIKEIIKEVEEFVAIEIEVDPKYHRELVGSNSSKLREIISKAGGDDASLGSKYNRLLSIPREDSGSKIVKSQGPKPIVNKIIEQINEFIAIKEASKSEDIEIPKDKHRFVIGPGGSVRRSLEHEFSVTMTIPKQDQDSNIIKLYGLPENVESLKQKLIELTKDDWNDSIDIPVVYHNLVSERGTIFGLLKTQYQVTVTHGKLSRKAAKLNKSSIPLPPDDLLPADGESRKFIVTNLSRPNPNEVIPWYLKGKKTKTTQVRELLVNRLQLAQKADFNAWLFCAKSSDFSKLIGFQGSVIKDLRTQSQAFITVPGPHEENPNFAYLVGTKDSLDVAESLIKKLI